MVAGLKKKKKRKEKKGSESLKGAIW